MRVRELIGLSLLLSVSCAPLEMELSEFDAEDDRGYGQVAGAIGEPTLTIDSIDSGYTVEFTVENWVYPLIFREITCYVDGGAYAGGQADGTTDDLEYTFLTIPKGGHRLCCVLTEDGEELLNCEATDCVTVIVWDCCQDHEDCDDGNPLTSEVCLNDTQGGGCATGKSCVYGYVATPGVCLSKYDCPCIEPAGQEVCVDNQCVPCGVCVDHLDCDDAEPCTFDWCEAEGSPDGCSGCRNIQILEPCCNPANGDNDCEDGDVCTLDFCNPDTLQCYYVGHTYAAQLAMGYACCEVHSDCQAGGIWEEEPQDNPATLDYCQDGQCIHIVIPCGCNCPIGENDCEGPCPDDGDPCTADLCSDCICVHPKIPGCCNDDEACVDDLICTVDSCMDNECVHEAWDWCCESPLECDDGSPCSFDQCINHACHYSGISTECCDSDLDCDDGDDCTIDYYDGCHCHNNWSMDCCVTDLECNLPPWMPENDPDYFCVTGICNPTVHQCEFVPTADCCSAASDCDDGNQCTEDFCFGASCKWMPLENCCESDADCEDENDCTINNCTKDPWDAETGICSFIPDYTQGGGGICCGTPADCADGDPCTTEYCFNNVCIHQSKPCCSSDSDCADSDPCTCDICLYSSCKHLPPGQSVNFPQCNVPLVCCSSVEDCDDGGPCTDAACVGNLCEYTAIPGCDSG